VMSQRMFQCRQVPNITIQPDKKLGHIKSILIYDGVVAGTDIQYLTRFYSSSTNTGDTALTLWRRNYFFF